MYLYVILFFQVVDYICQMPEYFQTLLTSTNPSFTYNKCIQGK